MRLGGAIGNVGRQVGNDAIFFLLGTFWLPLRKVAHGMAGFRLSAQCQSLCSCGLA